MANLQVATLAGGCFWCIESAFNSVEGVEKAISGYAGGEKADPTYEEVCKGNTGHAEVVQVTFDADSISYREILEIFFALHNPTQLNRQGNDVGTQYRSAVFYHDDTQKAEAEKIIAEITEEEIWPDPVVTEIVAVNNYYDAEDYHQDYFKNNPQNSSFGERAELIEDFLGTGHGGSVEFGGVLSEKQDIEWFIRADVVDSVSRLLAGVKLSFES